MIPEALWAQIPKDQRTVVQRAARLEWAAKCAEEKDILGWGQALMPEKFSLPFCRPLHEYLVDIRHDEFTDTEAPRNHAKTLIKCVLVPMFQGIYEPELFDYYMNVQATGLKAQAVNVAIRTEFENNDLLRELCGDLVGDDRWTDMQFVLKNDVVYQAISAGQSIRGTMHKNRRPNYWIFDDLYDEEHINNVEATMKIASWFWGSAYPARARTRRWSIHLQGTAINNYDLLEKLKKQPGVKARTFKAADFATKTALWPELNSFDQVVAEIARMGTVIGMRELQNERRDETTSIVKKSWLEPTDGAKDWAFDLADLKFDPHFRLVAVLLLVDPSIGEKEQNDFTGVHLVWVTQYDDAVDHANDYWVVDSWNEHLSLDKRIKLLCDIAAEQPNDRKVTQLRIEAIAGFNDFAAEAERRTSLPIHRVQTVKDKISNLESKSHYFENHKVHVNRRLGEKFSKEGLNLKDGLLYQLTTNYPQHDDLRDALLLGFDHQIKNMKKVNEGYDQLLRAMGQ